MSTELPDCRRAPLLDKAVGMGLRARWLRSVKPIVARIEAAQIRRTGTSVLARLFRTDVLVLVTSGRRTGRERRTPLACAAIADGWLISGGAGGQGQVDWVANLRANPLVHVVVGRRTFQVTAVEPIGPDYDAARTFVIKQWARVLNYEVAARRSVPIFELHRVDNE